MKIELNAVELEAAVVAHLANSGLDMKKKDITFEFEGTCSVSIEDQDTTAAKKTPTKRTTRKSKTTTNSTDTADTDEQKAEEKPKAKPKAAKKEKVEEKKEEEEAVVGDAVQKPVADTPESAEDLFGTPKAETETESDTDAADEDTSLFG